MRPQRRLPGVTIIVAKLAVVSHRRICRRLYHRHWQSCRSNRQVIGHSWTCRRLSSLSAIAVAGLVVDAQYAQEIPQQQQQKQTGTGFGAFGQTQPQQSTDFGTTQPQPWPRPQQPAGGLFDAGNSVFGLIRQAHVIIRSFLNCKNWDRALPSRFASGKFVGRDG